MNFESNAPSRKSRKATLQDFVKENAKEPKKKRPKRARQNLPRPVTTVLNGRVGLGMSFTSLQEVQKKKPAKPVPFLKRQSCVGLSAAESWRIPNAPAQQSEVFKSLQTRPVPAPANTEGSQSVEARVDDVNGGIDQFLEPAIRDVLRPHQIEAVEFLWTKTHPDSASGDDELHGRDTRVGGALLADDMGLGKTLTSIALLHATIQRQVLLQKRRADADETLKRLIAPKAVIVCPASLITNWKREMQRWIRIRGATPLNTVALENRNRDNTALLHRWVLSGAPSVVILSYDAYVKHATTINAVRGLCLLVADEAHRLKSTSGTMTSEAVSSFPCARRLAITGTPVQNSLLELFSMLNFVAPDILDQGWRPAPRTQSTKSATQQRLEHFRNKFYVPICRCSNTEVAQERERELETLCEQVMIRRTVADLDVAELALPRKTEIVLFCKPRGPQYEVLCELKSAALDKTVDEGGEKLSTFTELRRASTSCSLLEKEKKAPLTAESISSSAKLVVLRSLLRAIRLTGLRERVVIVCSFHETLSLAGFLAQEEGWDWLELDGRTSQSLRQPTVDAFERGAMDDGGPFLLLTTARAGGVGLNMTAARYLILLEMDWNPAIDDQAMARVYRMGQERDVTIFTLATMYSLDEVILNVQARKRAEVSKIGFSQGDVSDTTLLLGDTELCVTKSRVAEAQETSSTTEEDEGVLEKHDILSATRRMMDECDESGYLESARILR